MNYCRLPNEKLQQYPYPNLIAEWWESGYSICTLGDHMGLGCYREENDSEIWAKLRGEEAITASEALGLSRLFGVEAGYLFNKELTVFSEKPIAYWRWFDTNRRREEEMRQFKEREDIMSEMKKKPYLFKAFKVIARMSEPEMGKLLAAWKCNGSVPTIRSEGGDAA